MTGRVLECVFHCVFPALMHSIRPISPDMKGNQHNTTHALQTIVRHKFIIICIRHTPILHIIISSTRHRHCINVKMHVCYTIIVHYYKVHNY